MTPRLSVQEISILLQDVPYGTGELSHRKEYFHLESSIHIFWHEYYNNPTDKKFSIYHNGVLAFRASCRSGKWNVECTTGGDWHAQIKKLIQKAVSKKLLG